MWELPNLARSIADTYDAALQPELWGDVLARIAALVQGHVSGILAKNPVRRYVEARCRAALHEALCGDLFPTRPGATSLFSDAAAQRFGAFC